MEPRGNLVLVTGANGFVGERITRRLLAEGARVRAIVRKREAADELAREGVEVVLGELADPAVLRGAVEGARAVVHVAATASNDMAEAMRINAEATRVLAEAALAASVERFVHISTIAVHDLEGIEVVDEETPFVSGESAPTPYGASKAEGDRAIFGAIARGLRAVILRPGVVLGAHPTSTWGSIVPRGIAAGKFPLVAGGQGTLPYVHVENLVDAVLISLRLEAAVGQAFNIVDADTTWGRYIDAFRKGPLPPAPDNVPALSMFAFRGAFSNAKAKRVLGYAPTRTYDEAMAETLAFLGASEQDTQTSG